MRPADDPFVPTNAPARVAGLYRHDTDRLAWHVRVDRDVLRGSGRAVPDEIGVFLAGAPPLSLKLKHAGKDIPFGWPETSHVGPSIGSIRELALSAGSREGTSSDWSSTGPITRSRPISSTPRPRATPPR